MMTEFGELIQKAVLQQRQTPPVQDNSLLINLESAIRPAPEMTLTGGDTIPIQAEASLIPQQQFEAIKCHFENPVWPLYLYGQPGSGKTCAAAVIAMTFPGKYISFQSAKRIISDYSCGRFVRQIIATVRDCDLLILDDVGTRSLSDAAIESMLDILNARGAKPLIITCNHNPIELEVKIGDARISSRMTRGTVIGFPEADQRIQEARVF